MVPQTRCNALIWQQKMHNNLWLGFYVLPFQKVFENSNFNHNIELANRVRRKNRNKYLFAQNGKYKAIAHIK